MTERSNANSFGLTPTGAKELSTQSSFLKRHSLVIGLVLILLYT